MKLNAKLSKRESSYRRLFPGTMPTSVNTRKWWTTEVGCPI